MLSQSTCVKVRGVLTISEQLLAIRDGGREFKLESPWAPEALKTALSSLDGERTFGQFLAQFPASQQPAMAEVVSQLDRALLLDETPSTKHVSGLEALLMVEDLANELVGATILKNKFWAQVTDPEANVPLNVMYGQAIENYHFLFREAYFDSPVLCFQGSTKARLLMNEFYAEEIGHDELILLGLNAIGISREDITDTIPLPETMALCNALAYWATFDPLFFFTTLGILEGKDLTQIDSFTEACERMGLDAGFVKPIKTHAGINLQGQHGSLTRKIFKEIDVVDEATLERLLNQTRLFVELYDQYYTAVWNHYSTAPKLLRRISDVLEGT